MRVSYFNSMRSKAKEDITFDEYIDIVRKGIDKDYIKEIRELRKLYKDEDKQYKQKKETLPIITPHAIVEGKREDANVIKHSGIISVDVDTKDNSAATIRKFTDPNALAWHRSVSGEGLVIYYRANVDKRDHRAAFDSVANRLKQKFGIIADPHVKALSVPRFVSYDPNVVYNRTARPIKIVETNGKESHDLPKANKSDQIQLRELTQKILDEGANIVDDRESWVKMAAVYCRAFGGNEEGLDLFNSISKRSKKYVGKSDCAKVYKSFINKKTENPATIGSLVYLMEEAGIKVENNGAAKIKHFDDIDDDDDEEEVERKEKKKSKLMKLLESRLVTDEKPKEVEPIVKIDGITVCSVGNHSLVIGKMKARKSLFVSWLIQQAELDVDSEIFICDTEQGEMHTWEMRQRIKLLTKGKDPKVLRLRGLAPEVRQDLISLAVRKYRPWLLIIDGIRDLMYDINDTKECTRVVTWIEDMTMDGTHVINVLHENKTNTDARGHIGSELLNKSETVFKLVISSQDKNRSIVKCEHSRGLPFEDFEIGHKMDPHNMSGIAIPEKYKLTEKQKKGQFDEKDIAKKLDELFGNKMELGSAELKNGIGELFGIGNTRVKSLITELVDQNWLIRKGSVLSKTKTYRVGKKME